MKVLDLFSGIGGFALGLEAAGFETVAFCEIDPYAQKVLKKNWPGVPIYEDVREKPRGSSSKGRKVEKVALYISIGKAWR
jgi:site-specific DNA-cytosine methylase